MSVAMSDAQVEEYAKTLERLPSPATISRYVVTLDMAYCKLCHTMWSEVPAQRSQVAITLMADSSPQLDSDCFLCEAVVMHELPKLCGLVGQLLGAVPSEQDTTGDDSPSDTWWLVLPKQELDELMHCNTALRGFSLAAYVASMRA